MWAISISIYVCGHLLAKKLTYALCNVKIPDAQLCKGRPYNLLIPITDQ